ncbi:MaoC family dehydratase N-terminal domain-containing protein [Angustibacter sp. Root456]|uniref:FAS1-like dehydratase domain-containing protein n=1 Tax=Angustibacter sp. Root456 TaxID=1736539 RepID=UPI0006FB11C5|nr:MaoC family dehydratase N-terminal domain-containing protein [Angustibacter sp. Root456]KQX62817.1 hypothetical protein ASD06_12405 [Angustibacter sp. Root456]
MTSLPDLDALAERWQVTASDLVRYAAASLDLNDIHQDDRAARAAGFEGRIAHGMLTLGRVLARLADAVGPRGIASCSARFSAPVRPGVPLSLTWQEQPSARPAGRALRATVTAGAAQPATALVLDVELADGSTAQVAEDSTDGFTSALHHGELLADMRLLVERGPAQQLARAVGAQAPWYVDPAAATAVGLDGLAVVPTLPFVLPGWGWFADLQDDAVGGAPDAVEDSRRWAGTSDAVVHAGQGFTFHRPIVVGELLRSRQLRTGGFTREGRAGTLRFTEVTQVLTGADGALVATSVATLLATGPA